MQPVDKILPIKSHQKYTQKKKKKKNPITVPDGFS